MALKRGISYLLLSILLLIGCSENNDRYNFVYQTYEVDAPTDVDLNQDIEDLYPSDFDFIISETDSGKEWQYLKGSFLEVINDSVLAIVDNRKTSIKKVNIDSNKLLEEVSNRGRGPGEYIAIDNMVRTDSSLLVLDKNLSKLIEYNFNFKHIRDIQLTDTGLLDPLISASYNSSNYYYPIMDVERDGYLIRQLKISNTDSSLSYKNFHKRLIPLGKQPRAYNWSIVDVAENNQLFVVSRMMPLFFKYNEQLKLENLYKLKLADIHKFETKSDNIGGVNNSGDNTVLVNPKPQILDGNQRVRLNGFTILDAVFTDNMAFIFFMSQSIKDRYLIVLDKQEEGWTHSGSYRFYKDIDELFTVFNLDYYEPWLYLSSRYEDGIIRINTEKL